MSNINLSESLKAIAKQSGYSRLKFEFEIGDKERETALNEFEFSTRAKKVLKRAGFSTLADLAEYVNSSDDLSKFENCGAGTQKEIINVLINYHIEKNVEKKRKPLHGITLTR